MTVVKIELYDQQEMVWFTQFHAALMQYRDEQTRQMEAELDEQLDAELEPGEEPEARVVGHIPTLEEIMAPTLAELTAAVQASLVGDAMPAQVEKVKGLLARYGAKVLSEVPEDKRAELIEGLK